MSEHITETVAQLQHENLKLLDELKHLREHTFSAEEAYNLQTSELIKEKKHAKSLEQQCDYFCQLAKEREHLIDLLEHDKKKLIKLNNELSSEKILLKGKLMEEMLKNKELETLKIHEEELKNACIKLKEKNQKLISELSLRSEECSLNAATIQDLVLQIKELEHEKAQLLASRDMLLLEEKEEQLKSLENLEEFDHRDIQLEILHQALVSLKYGSSHVKETDFRESSSSTISDLVQISQEYTLCSLRKSPEWLKSEMNSCTQNEVNFSPTGEKINLNLREEILEVELREQQLKIGQLENLLRQKEEEELQRNQTIIELKQKLSNVGLLSYNSKIDLRLDSAAFNDIYSHLLKLLNWPDGHSGECNALTEVASLSLVVKDGVQATQPSCVRIIETISIASQTDPVKNLSPVLPFKSFEKLQSDQIPSDSDDESEESLAAVENRVRKGFHLFTDIKNCNLDMDLYRSCRKLSVLPEEDTDESFNRKCSFKKSSNSKFYSFNSKTQSADDITNITSKNSLLKGSSSYSNISSRNHKTKENISLELLWRNHNSNNPDLKNTDKENLVTFNDKQFGDFEFVRQPCSFDSYLDPANKQSTSLPRQISDPTQQTGLTSSVTRRGSYIRKPKSTCRPLTLPCDKSEKKREDRICRVRFDLNGVAFKRDDNVMERTLNDSALNSTKKTKIVSRFKVEIVDETEFRKSLEENSRSTALNRKRPPLVHSTAYKKSALRESVNFVERNDLILNNVSKPMKLQSESPDSPVYDTAAEDSSSESFDDDNLERDYMNNLYPFKRRKQSNISCNSFDDSQENSEKNDILLKSIKLHSNSDCLIMKELKKECSESSSSNANSEIPYIDAEDLPVIKSSADVIKLDPIPETFFLDIQHSNTVTLSPGSLSEGSDTFFTPSDVTPVSESNELLTSGKSSGLSKSPTVLKNLANFELLAALSESRKLLQSEMIKEEKTEEEDQDKLVGFEEDKKNSNETLRESLNQTSSDISETSESDTLTYGTVKSHVTASSDCDSDTYITVWSDRSFGLERKFSDLSENSSSPYNTPPDTSSASFCTPPDTYSPILNSLKKIPGIYTDKFVRNQDNAYSSKNINLHEKMDSPNSSPLLQNPCRFESENNGVCSGTEILNSTELKANANFSMVFESPKLEFYETNDSIEDLEAFLQTEEGLRFESQVKEKPNNRESLHDSRLLEMDEFVKAFSRQNNLESPMLLERRSKKHPPLSRQNSTEEYLFLDPHDSCLNLSEEISSPSTTPDTSNKTVIFKSIPLTMSSTIDLEDDFSISETEIQINLDGSQSEIMEAKEKPIVRYTKDLQCFSEPCTPSIGSADFLSFSVPRKHRSSFTEDSLMHGKPRTHLPEIIVSNLSSESENPELGVPECAETDFASNVSDRSEIHLSDVNSNSEHSDNSYSLSEHSGNVVLEVSSSNSDKSSAASFDATAVSSPDKSLLMENFGRDQQPPESSSVGPVSIDEDPNLTNPDLL